MEESSATIFKGLELSKEDIKFLSKYWKREVFKKGSLIFDSEKKVVDQYYVLKGCLMKWWNYNCYFFLNLHSILFSGQMLFPIGAF